MRKERTSLLGTSTFALHVESYNEGQMQGMVDGPLLSEPIVFKSLPQLILMLDSLMDDDLQAPLTLSRSSSFMPLLELEVLFRQHYSWQGNIRRLDNDRTIAFRSVLELIVALDNLLSE